MQGNLPTAKTCMGHAEDGTPCDREEFGKGTSSPHLLVLGFPPPASFLTISPLGEVSTFKPSFAQLGICPEDEEEGVEPMRDKP